MSKAPSRSQDQFIVRLPDGLRDRIKMAAEENGRSMNAEVVATLLREYPETPPLDAVRRYLDRFVRWADNTEMDYDLGREARLILHQLDQLERLKESASIRSYD